MRWFIANELRGERRLNRFLSVNIKLFPFLGEKQALGTSRADYATPISKSVERSRYGVYIRARSALGNIFGTVSRKQMNQKELKITARCADRDAFEKQKHNHPSVINLFWNAQPCGCNRVSFRRKSYCIPRAANALLTHRPPRFSHHNKITNAADWDQEQTMVLRLSSDKSAWVFLPQK